MSDKKLPKIKHNHTLTDILKASIFSLVMMAPVTAIGVTCAYVVCNKNAYQSYSGKNDSNMILQNVDSFEKNKKYNLQTHNNTYDSQITEAQNYIVASKVFISDSVYTNIRIGFYRVAGSTEANVYLRELDNNNNLIYTGNLANTNLQVNVSFIYDYQVNTFSNTLYQFFNFQDYMTNYYQDNVFYYAVDNMQNNSLFSWTKTTAIYTPVNAMTTGMGINTPAIAVLLVYWLLCTAVYIIIDIVVKGFTWLTHLIGER